MSLFGIVALLSIYPTVRFLSRAPVVPAAKLRLILKLVHLELAGIASLRL